MDSNYITLKQSDKYKTHIYPYRTKLDCKGSVVVLHGMAEHHERYEPFAKFLNDNGYDVFLYDHRGHGKDKKHEELGFFAESNGYKKVIGDAIRVLRYAKQENRGEKIFLFGHSMGSMMARCVIQYLDGIDGVVICGTSYMKPLVIRGGIILSSIIKFFKGARHISPYMNKLCVGGKAYTQLSKRTAFDWLSRDNTVVGSYIGDPYCGYVCTVSFYKDLIKLCQQSGNPKMMARTRKDLPMLLIAGDHDPVGGCGKDVQRLFTAIQKMGFTKAECTLYEDCRHELLNELNRDEIMKDILDWFEAQDSGRGDENSNRDEDLFPETDTKEQDEEEVLAQIRQTYHKIINPEETEGEKKLAELRAKKLAKKQQEADK